MQQQAAVWLDEADNKVEDAKKLVLEKFQMIREAIDKKEKEMLECLGECAADLDPTKELIDSARELACEIPLILEDGKALLRKEEEKDDDDEEEEEEENILSIKEKAERSEDIIKELTLLKKCEAYADTEGFLRGVKRRLEDIGGIKELPMKRVLRSAPTGLAVEKVTSDFVILRWDESEEFREYTIQKREEGCEWDDGEDDLIRVGKKKGTRCFVYPLKPETTYEFRVKGWDVNGIETVWSGAVSANTCEKTFVVGAYGAVHDLRESISNGAMCCRLLEDIISILEIGGKKSF